MSKDKGDLYTAMMLLEMAIEDGDDIDDKHRSVVDYAIAAHSYIQKYALGVHTGDGAEELVARIKADDAIKNAMHSAPED